MRLQGTYQHGVIVPVEKLDLPEGTPVSIEVDTAAVDVSSESIPSDNREEKPGGAAASLLRFAGIMTRQNLPADGSRNHDHYIYGSPKRDPE